jgi:hypothetical protein
MRPHHEVYLVKELRVILIDVLEASNKNLVIHCVDLRSFFVDGSVSHIKEKLEVILGHSIGIIDESCDCGSDDKKTRALLQYRIDVFVRGP